MAKQLLPNGSVVTLKGATKKLMTIGIEVEMEGDEKTYDYIAIPYPEGYIDSETMFLFYAGGYRERIFRRFCRCTIAGFSNCVGRNR